MLFGVRKPVTKWLLVAFLLLVVWPGAPSSFLFLVASEKDILKNVDVQLQARLLHSNLQIDI